MTQASAVVVADSISPDGIRLTTFQLKYWRPLHPELMTHRVFSRNAGSSRARPSQKIIDQVRDAPWGPIHWGSNKPGMQAGDELIGPQLENAQFAWKDAAYQAAECAARMLEQGVHKQIVNRLLEPFTYIDVLVTATDFANWFMLRDHPDAQPEIRELAQLMRHEYEQSIPDRLYEGMWHLPYITPDDWDAAALEYQVGRTTRDMPSYREKLEIVLKISVARCARVSYKAFDGNVAPIEKDLELYEQLLVSQPLHASPAEHQATPQTPITFTSSHPSMDNPYGEPMEYEFFGMPDSWSNLRGWLQFRKTIPNEFLPG